MRIFLSRVFLCCPVFFLFFPCAFPVAAQQFSFSLAPQQHQIIAQPGREISLPYNLTNFGDPTVVRLQSSVLHLTDSRGSYKLIPYYSDNPSLPALSSSDPSRPINQPFLLGSRDSLDFDILLTIPPDTPEGDYYFTITAESEPYRGFEEESHIALQGGVGSNIYITVSHAGDIVPTGEIVQFALKSNNTIMIGDTSFVLVDSFEEIPVVLTVANTGAHLFEAEGSITLVRDYIFPAEIGRYALPSHLVLSNAQRILTPPDFVFPKKTAGIYTAQAEITYGRDGNSETGQLHFIVFPVTLLAVISSVILLALFGVLILKKNRGKRDL